MAKEHVKEVAGEGSCGPAGPGRASCRLPQVEWCQVPCGTSFPARLRRPSASVCGPGWVAQ